MGVATFIGLMVAVVFAFLVTPVGVDNETPSADTEASPQPPTGSAERT